MGYSKDNSRVAKLAAEEALTQAQRAELAANSVEDVIADSEQVTLDNKIIPLTTVDTVALRNSTYPNPLNGSLVTVNQGANGNAETYRFVMGTGWVLVDKYNGTMISNITSQLAENAKYAGQADFVNLVRDRTKYNRLRIRKNPNAETVLDVIIDNGTKHITYDFIKNTNDDFVLFRTGYLANLGVALFDKRNYESNFGTWITSAAPNYYTQQVGATFTGKVKGSEIRFGSPTDNRGGIFEFVIDGNTANPITISTYSYTFVAFSEQVVKIGLTDTEHTIVGTFKGDDPANAPSGGAGTARGWVYVNNSPTTWADRWTFKGYHKEVANTYQDGKMLLGYGSNKEFAFQITKNGVSQYFPEHNSVGTAFDATAKQYLLDDVPFDFSGMVLGQFYEGKSFKLIQKMNCQIPNISGNMAKLTVTHTIGIDGVITISGEIEFLQDCMVNGYGLMFPTNMPVVNEFVSAIGNSIVNPGDNNMAYFPEEQDRVYSFCAVDQRNPSLIAAMTADFPNKTLRIGKTGRQSRDKIWMLWQRNPYPKLYGWVYNNHNLVAGEKFKWFGRFVIGEIDNIYNYVK